jgi:hypothetical protein
MANLTRIKNNQITDSTILANIKIVPGSIVGSLFNSNLTMTSDVTITGNLTVQGSSTYLTVASTNTYVNDPLIVLNNAFTGTNTYDVGLIFNRGNQTATALTWNEASKEFRLSFTAETGTSYGAISLSSYANLHLGNLTVDYLGTLGNISTAGNISANFATLTGDIAVNGGDITSTASIFGLLPTPTTINFGNAATFLNIGASTSLIDLNGANIYLPNATTIFSGQTTLSLANTVTTTVNAFGSVTALNFGATTGTATINNANINLPNASTIFTGQATLSLANTVTTTLNAFGAVTTANIGAGTGTITINNPTLVGQQPTQNLYNTLATTMNFAGAATNMTVGAATGTANIRNANISFPNATTINGGTATISLLDQATTVTAFNAATNITVGATTGTANIRNANISFPNATTINGGTATISLLDQATTVTAFNAATNITVGATTGTANIRNANIWLPNATSIDGAQATVGILNNATTVNAFDSATTANIGAGTGTITINNPTLVGQQPTQNLYNTLATTMNFAGAATNITVGATTGTANIRNANISFPNATTINGGTATISLLDQATTVTAFNAATTLTMGATTGTANIRNANIYLPNATTIFSGQPSLTIANTVTTSLSIGGAASTFILGATGGTTSSLGNTVVQSTFNATAFNNGSFVVAGGAGFAKDVYINGNLYVANIISTSQSILTVTDPLLYLSSSTTYPYNYDIGIYSHFIGGAGNIYQHTGFVRNDADSAWYLFSNIAEPTAGQIDLTNATYDKLVIGNLLLKTSTGIVTDQTSVDVVNTTATTVNAFGAATNLTVGATTGTANIRNANIYLPNATTIYSGQTTFSIANEVPTTVTAFGAATTLTIGATTGTASIRSANVWLPSATVYGGPQTTVSVWALPTTVTAYGNASTLTIGNISGTMTLNNPTVVGSQTVQNLYNSVASTINFGNAATSMNFGASNSLLNLNGSNIYLPNATTIFSGQTTLSFANTVSTTVNAFGSATTLNLSSGTGSTTIRNSTSSLGILYANSATTSTTTGTGGLVVAGGAGIAGNAYVGAAMIATGGAVSTGIFAGTYSDGIILDYVHPMGRISVGASDGLTIYNGGLANTALLAIQANGSASLTGNLNVLGTGIDTTVTTLGVFNTTATTVNAFGAATTINMGASNSLINLNGSNIYLPNATTIFSGQTTLSFANTVSTTVNAFGAATTLNFGAGTGVTTIRNSSTHLGIMFANSATVSTSTATGGLVVAGGVGIGSNIWVANGAVINSAQTSDNFTVRGAFTTSMIYANSNTGAVVIGGSNLAIQGGTTLKVNGTDSMMVPVGTTGQRPGLSGNVDVVGMLRYNSSVSTVEFYNGTSWNSVTGGFTILTSDQFSGNGVANVFTLGGNVTTEGAMVSINGTVQAPTLAYAISGNVLTMSEAPAVGDLIEVRRVTTTSTVSSIQTGYANVTVDITSANVFTGTSSSIQRINVDGGGNVGLVNGSKLTFNQTATTVGTGAVTIDSFDITKYRSAKYICQFTSQVTGYEVTEILVVHNGTAVTKVEYSKISTTGVNLAVYTTSLTGGAVNLLCAGVANTTNLVKISATYIAV